MTVEVLDRWEDDLAGRYQARSDLPGKRATHLFRYLRAVEQHSGPGRIDASVAKRISQPPTRPNKSFYRPVPDFAAGEIDRLILAARRTLKGTEKRIGEGRQVAAHGGDPRLTDAWTWPNVVWLAARQELTHTAVRPHLSRLWRDWPDSLRAVTSAGAAGKGNVDALISLAYRHVFPHPVDLMGHFALMALDIGAAPESLKDLTVDDIVRDPEHHVVEVRLTKLRAHLEMTRRFADAGADVPERERLRDAGTTLQSLVDVTSAVRAATGLRHLFVGGVLNHNWPGVKLGTVSWDKFPLRQWILASGLDCPSVATRHKGSGEVSVTLPAVSEPWDLRRFRKSNRAHLAVHHPEQLASWRDNTPEVFQRHYVVSSTVFMTHIGRLAARASGSLADGVRRTADCTVIHPSAQPAVANRSEAMAAVLKIGVADLGRLAGGDLDVDGGIAACKDVHASPFAAPGELCRAARLGLCPTCPNAVITVDHRDGLRRFDEEIIENHRRNLDPVEFAQRWLPIRLVVRDIRAQLGEADPEVAS